MIIHAKIKPNAKEFDIKQGNPWEIRVRHSPKDNKANLELIKEMSKRFGYCRIVHGKTSSHKILEINL